MDPTLATRRRQVKKRHAPLPPNPFTGQIEDTDGHSEEEVVEFDVEEVKLS